MDYTPCFYQKPEQLVTGLRYVVFLFTACNIRYNVTIVILRATITELTADVLVDGVRFFRYPANITEEKMEDDLLKSRVQRVEGHKGDLNSFLSAIMKDFNHTKGEI